MGARLCLLLGVDPPDTRIAVIDTKPLGQGINHMLEGRGQVVVRIEVPCRQPGEGDDDGRRRRLEAAHVQAYDLALVLLSFGSHLPAVAAVEQADGLQRDFDSDGHGSEQIAAHCEGHFVERERRFANSWTTHSSTEARPGLPGKRSMAASMAAATCLCGWVVITNREQH